jgi:hypothetical protein
MDDVNTKYVKEKSYVKVKERELAYRKEVAGVLTVGPVVVIGLAGNPSSNLTGAIRLCSRWFLSRWSTCSSRWSTYSWCHCWFGGLTASKEVTQRTLTTTRATATAHLDCWKEKLYKDLIRYQALFQHTLYKGTRETMQIKLILSIYRKVLKIPKSVWIYHQHLVRIQFSKGQSKTEKI